jgi:hypothetical protein
MDPASLVSAMMGAQVGRAQIAVAAKIMRMNADQDQAVAGLLEAAQKNADALVKAAQGIGTQLDISV